MTEQDGQHVLSVTADGVTVKYDYQQLVDGVWVAMRQLGQAIQPAAAALRRFGVAMGRVYAAYAALDWESFLSARQQEIAFRRYAAYYTATHPRGLSWRRLNRPQRCAAAFAYWMDREDNAA